MSIALCFTCAALKPGAQFACPHCRAGGTGDEALDAEFSTEHMSEATLHGFADALKAIHEASDDDRTRFWTFLRYVSVNHPEVADVDMPAARAEEYDAIIGRANILPVTVEEPAPRAAEANPEHDPVSDLAVNEVDPLQ